MDEAPETEAAPKDEAAAEPLLWRACMQGAPETDPARVKETAELASQLQQAYAIQQAVGRRDLVATELA